MSGKRPSNCCWVARSFSFVILSNPFSEQTWLRIPMCLAIRMRNSQPTLPPVYHMFKKSSTHSQLLAVGCGVACFPRCLFCCTQSVAPTVCPLRSWSPNLESEQHLAQSFGPCIKLVFVAGNSGRAKGRSTCLCRNQLHMCNIQSDSVRA